MAKRFAPDLPGARSCAGRRGPGWALVGCFAGLFAVGVAWGAEVRGQDGPPSLSQQAQRAYQTILGKVAQFRAVRDYKRAAVQAERLVKKFPQFGPAWMVLAESHLESSWASRNDARAEDAAQRALDLVGRNPIILHHLALAKFRNRRDGAEELIGELVVAPAAQKLGAQPVAELLVCRARLRLEGEARPEILAGARADLDQAIQLIPKFGLARLWRGHARYDDADYDGALEDLLVAVERMPGNHEVHFKLFRCYQRKRDAEKATLHNRISKLILDLVDSQSLRSAPSDDLRITILRELAEKNPADVSRHVELVDRLILAENLDEAQEQYETLRARYEDYRPLVGLKQRIEAARRGADEANGAAEDDDGH